MPRAPADLQSELRPICAKTKSWRMALEDRACGLSLSHCEVRRVGCQQLEIGWRGRDPGRVSMQDSLERHNNTGARLQALGYAF